MIKTKLTALASAGALLAMTAPGAFAQNIAADYNNSALSDGDGDIVAAFNLYDLAVGATLIQAAATNVGTAAAPVVGDRFTGYYQSYVTAHQLDGVVQNVAPDAVVDERTGEVHFLVRIALPGNCFPTENAGCLPLGPGMLADVSLLGPKRSVLSYLLSPLTQITSSAFREK